MTIRTYIVDDSTATTVILGADNPADENPIFIVEIDLGFPDVRTDVTPNPSGHGTVDLTALHGARTVTMKLKIHDDVTFTRYEYIDILRGMCHPAKRPYLYLLRDGWVGERRMQLRANQFSCLLNRDTALFAEVSLSFQVPNGLMEETPAESVTMIPPSASAGLSLPVSWLSPGVSFTPSSLTNQFIVTNLGTAEIYPVVKFYGGGQNPALHNLDSGQVLQFANLTIAAGHYLEVDFFNKTAYMDSDSGFSYYGFIDWSAGSPWWALEPGDNLVSFDMVSPDSIAQAQLTWVSKWI